MPELQARQGGVASAQDTSPVISITIACSGSLHGALIDRAMNRQRRISLLR
jgi:hypothetical protein